MASANYRTAMLDKATLDTIQQLENELALVLVAIEPDPQPAMLNEEQLHRIQALEKQTGKVLLAYS